MVPVDIKPKIASEVGSGITFAPTVEFWLMVKM
jgi:hypothetical protein